MGAYAKDAMARSIDGDTASTLGSGAGLPIVSESQAPVEEGAAERRPLEQDYLTDPRLSVLPHFILSRRHPIFIGATAAV